MLTPQDSSLISDADMAELLTDYVANLQQYAADLRRLLAAKDTDAVARLLHQLKGSGRSYGYPKITELAASAEAPLRTGGARALSDVAPIVEALLRYIDTGA